MATTIRKTAKFYREELVKRQTSTDFETLIKEVCTKFGGKEKEISLWKRVEFNWNHRVEGFRVSSTNGRVLVKVYWQGDSTDGDDYVYLTDVLRRGIDVIPAKHYFDCGRTYEVHSDIRVEKEEIDSLIAELAKWLSPAEVKARKIADQIYTIKCEVTKKLGNEYYNQYASKGWGCKNEEYYNGRRAVTEWLDNAGKDLLKMDMETIFKVVDTIFHKNYKSDYYFGKNWNGDRTKPYDLSF